MREDGEVEDEVFYISLLGKKLQRGIVFILLGLNCREFIFTTFFLLNWH
jgi:hypothetical protein